MASLSTTDLDVNARVAAPPWVDAILRSYASVLFSHRRTVGALLLLATFNQPVSGMTGLAGVLVSLIFARAVGYSRELRHQGYLSFNALLSSLAVAFLFADAPVHWPLYWLLVILASVGSVLLTVSLGEILRYYLRLPVMSWPFVLITIILCCLAFFVTGRPVAPLPPFLLVHNPACLPRMLAAFLLAFGNIFFQSNALAGLLVLIALAIESRIAVLLSIVGFAAGAATLYQVGLAAGGVAFTQISFNFVLIAIALGGIFLVPSPSSYLYAALGSSMGALVGVATVVALDRIAIPPLALPFNLVTLLLLHSLRFRARIGAPVPVEHLPGSPEENLNFFLNRMERYGRYRNTPFFLPFLGTWTVTQASDTEVTHQEPWQHAWDFEVTDADGRLYRDLGTEPKDYYAYDLPVVAPAEGTVVSVVDQVPDNPVGQFNTEQNWGNRVVLSHGVGIYSVVCHLRPDSLKVKVGEVVKPGQVLGRCGNSGRSSVPHLHFHVQVAPELGSATIPIEFLRYVEETPAGQMFRLNGVPAHGMRLRRFEGEPAIGNILRLNVGEVTHFKVQAGRREFDESWRTTIDLFGYYYICSSRGARLFFYLDNGVYTAVDFQGSRRSALYAFFLASSRLPYQNQDGLCWEDRISSRFILRGMPALVVNTLRSFGETVPVHCRSTLGSGVASDGGNSCRVVTTQIEAFLRPRLTARLSFAANSGILKIHLEAHERLLMEARRVDAPGDDLKT
jgi:urea transporter